MPNHSHHMLTRAEIQDHFTDWSDPLAALSWLERPLDIERATAIWEVQLAGRTHGRLGLYPKGDFNSDDAWCYGVGARIGELESALEIDDGSIGRLYEEAHSAYFADGTINPNDRNGSFSRDQGIYDLSFGAYGDTKVSVHAASADDALEIAAEHLKVIAPGLFSEPDYAEAAKELGLAWPLEDEEDTERVAEKAEVDHTYTESGWLLSHEWTIDGPR